SQLFALDVCLCDAFA
ncbi:DUF645 family protein, partial [Vibrio cholerae]|nr:DUF645 family protein [Vibrio cholerae]